MDRAWGCVKGCRLSCGRCSLLASALFFFFFLTRFGIKLELIWVSLLPLVTNCLAATTVPSGGFGLGFLEPGLEFVGGHVDQVVEFAGRESVYYLPSMDVAY